jgi:AraC-like DNA-binding protein
MVESSLVESCANEWSRYYRLPDASDLEVLHARFVEHRFARHSHEYFVVSYIEEGVQAYHYRQARHVTPAGQMFLVNAGEPHTGEPASEQGYVYRTMYPRASLLQQVAAEVTGSHTLHLFDEAVIDDPVLVQLLRQFHSALIDSAPCLCSESLLRSALEHLIVRYGSPRPLVRSVGRERPGVRRAREYLHANYSRDVPLRALAEAANLSPFHLARAFVREVGHPPHVYLDMIRVQRARVLLAGGSSIADVATAVGYADQSHLTRRFKRLLGMTPGQFARGTGTVAVRASGFPH